METVLRLPTKGGVVQKQLALNSRERLFPQMVPCIFKMRGNIVFLLQLHKRYKNLACISYKWSKDKIKSKCGCLTFIYNKFEKKYRTIKPQTLSTHLAVSSPLRLSFHKILDAKYFLRDCKGKKMKRRKLRHCLLLLTSNSSASVLAG